jgi:hypothetical protein
MILAEYLVMRIVKRSVLMAALLTVIPGSAQAQTEGRVSVGGSVTFNNTTDSNVSSVLGVGPLVRLNPRKGWGPAAALNWFRADLNNPTGSGGEFAQLRAWPLMAGVAYSIERGRALTSFSIVAGPSFNRARFHKDFPAPGGSHIEAENSLAVRPGVGVTWTVAPRVAIVGFGGYLINRPDTVYRSPGGNEFVNQWKADSVVLSVGAVYSLF